jgi:hypothetical protein
MGEQQAPTEEIEMTTEIAYEGDEPCAYCEVGTEDGAVQLYLEARYDDGESYAMNQTLTPAQALALIASLTRAVADLV